MQRQNKYLRYVGRYQKIDTVSNISHNAMETEITMHDFG